MLQIYRRHLKKCRHRSANFHKCGCPIWARGKVNAVEVRKSLETRNWEAAGRIIREWEQTGVEAGTVTIADACDKYYAYAQASGLKPPTLAKYKLLFDELKTEFAGRPVESITTDDLSIYRASWRCGQVTARGKIGRLRAFFHFCVERSWVRTNPASGLKLPKEKFRPKIPYSKEELEKILWACEVYPKQGRYGERTGERVKAFILTLRYTGLRIRDVCLLRRTSVQDSQVMLYQAKTGLPVWIPIPKEVEELLAKVMNGAKYIFWSGEGNVKSAIGDWQRTMTILSRLSGVHVFAHRFRVNLACELLQNGVSIDKVALILGHSVRMLEKHYAPFIKARQESLTEAVQSVWKKA